MLDKNNKLDIIYGDPIDHHLILIWYPRFSHSNEHPYYAFTISFIDMLRTSINSITHGYSLSEFSSQRTYVMNTTFNVSIQATT